MTNSANNIAVEWDQNVTCRALELENKLDDSYFEIIMPTVLKHIKRHSFLNNKALDIGCGLGFLTNSLHEIGLDVCGIDISLNSINYAKSRFKQIPFFNVELGDFCKDKIALYDIALAVMFFHNCTDLKNNLISIKKILKENGLLIVFIPHPCFWYRRFEGISYINPDNAVENSYKVDFKIRKGQKHDSKVTYYHRTLETYINLIKSCGLKIVAFEETGNDGKSKVDLLFMILKNTAQ